ncbi:MAG TPA: hypothetical protein VLU54_05060 [Casimicrobiaceae bacterium]|nr:hypothetical protein [Casimicrobiaceae bacterium]
MLDLLLVVSTDRAAELLVPLAAAARRRRTVLGCFFTNDGVKLLGDEEVRAAIDGAAAAVACEHSWGRFMGDALCPVELGSQTDHSALVARAARVVAI